MIKIDKPSYPFWLPPLTVERDNLIWRFTFESGTMKALVSVHINVDPFRPCPSVAEKINELLQNHPSAAEGVSVSEAGDRS